MMSGRALDHGQRGRGAWILYEYDTMQRLDDSRPRLL